MDEEMDEEMDSENVSVDLLDVCDCRLAQEYQNLLASFADSDGDPGAIIELAQEYQNFLAGFADCGGNPKTTVEQIVAKMKAKRQSTKLIQSQTSSSSSTAGVAEEGKQLESCVLFNTLLKTVLSLSIVNAALYYAPMDIIILNSFTEL